MDPTGEEDYRSHLRTHFRHIIKNPKLQLSTNSTVPSTVDRSKLTEFCKLQQCTAQQYKDHVQRTQKLNEYNYLQQRRQVSHLSGGDADRALHDAHVPDLSSQADSYRGRCYNERNGFNRQSHFKSKAMAALPVPGGANQHKYHSDDANVFLCETDSNIGAGGPGSEESNKSLKSSKTVVSKKSSQDLRKMVKSQVKLQEVIDETLKQMCSTDPEPLPESVDCRLRDQGEQMGLQKTSGSCKRCTDKIYSRSSQKDVMTEIPKGDFLECRSGDTLTISVDDVVNSKVINPMIRKLQRMYLNNLREEMSLMEDLERLPHKVNEVYKATIFKQKE
ncbi:uncharacterized protein LOC118741752 [Rhagoletis pomonella]|uniref:uncharacterized protein LOC118741752 n=1 Tax=Rhagoletis pomonella TaxID=28610 RepID=UPI0017823ACB|nr:uncharacterized protein LOC118741752 [Rhagoletis pomonella]